MVRRTSDQTSAGAKGWESTSWIRREKYHGMAVATEYDSPIPYIISCIPDAYLSVVFLSDAHDVPTRQPCPDRE